MATGAEPLPLLASVALATLVACGAGVAKAEDGVCGDVISATTAVECTMSNYPGITYVEGGTIELKNPAMTVNGDITIGAISDNSSLASLLMTQYLTVNGDILAQSKLGKASVKITDGSSSDATVNGSVHALATVLTDATITMTGGTVTFAQDGAAALAALASYGNASTTMSGGSVITTGNLSPGVASEIDNIASTGTVTLTLEGGAITTSGTASHGLSARNVGAGEVSISMTEGTIQVSGTDSLGIGVSNSANSKSTKVDLSRGLITASGDAKAAIGIPSDSTVTTISDNIRITIGAEMVVDASAASNGYSIWKGAEGWARSFIVSTSGTVTGAAMMGSGDSTFAISGGTFTGNVYGDYDQSRDPATLPTDQGLDLFLWSGGAFYGTFFGQGSGDAAYFGSEIANEQLQLPDPSTYALDGGDADSASDYLQYQGVTGKIDASRLTNWEVIYLQDSAIEMSGRLDLDTTGSSGFGDLWIAGGSTLTIDTSAGDSTLNGNVQLVSDMVIEPRVSVSASGLSEFQVKGSGQVTVGGNFMLGGGTLNLADGVTHTSLLVSGNYTGNGGSVVLDVDFHRMSSYTIYGSDTLSLNGQVSGSTTISINAANSGNPVGGYTLLIALDPADLSSDNAFVLEGGIYFASVYAYQLVLNKNTSVYAPYLSFGYYLSSSGRVSFEEIQTLDFSDSRNLRQWIAAGVTLQPYVPLYEAYPSVVLDMMRMPSLSGRTGGRYDHGTALSSGPALDAVWGRVHSAFSHNDPQDSTTSYDSDLSQFELQTGLDGLLVDNDAGILVAGLTGSYRNGEATIHSRYGDSKIRPTGWGLGATTTWFSTGGFYFDGQADMTWFTSELKADDLVFSPEDSDAFGYGLSAEIGQSIVVAEGVSLTPQAQLSFTSVSIDGFTGAYSDKVDFDRGQSLLGRVGIELEKASAWQDAAGRARSARLYGTAGLSHEFLGETSATVSELYNFTSQPDDWSGDIALGMSYDWRTAKLHFSAYAELAASSGLNSGSYGYGGNIGLKIKW
ncbi:autotransporter outer membrane beta-barrel domain-containing protein [Martelella sp. HB161492]|uniref:autotransporter family protein n=1 Tax=Martelella sp. HB161492 TaxID=2720726 RepID=UPI0015920561|nr:autotransporter outer membrane beta-barrel domain-containing protein [Martelella sp. HB161492]